MPPKTALLLCYIFIFIIIRIDSKKNVDVSLALWIPFLWLLNCGSRPVAFWLNPNPTLTAEEIDYLSGNPVDRNFFIILMVIGIIILLRRHINWAQLFRNNQFLIILFLFMGLSILWSDYKPVSFKRWFRAIGDLMMVFIVLTESNPAEAVERVIRRCAYVLIPLSFICIKYFRNIGVIYNREGYQMWVGVTGHKNTLGMLTSFCAIFFLWCVYKDWKNKNLRSKQFFINLILLSMSLWLLNAGGAYGSSTALFIFILGTSSLIALNLLKAKIAYINTYIISVVILITFLNVGAELIFQDSLIEIIVKSTGKDMTFTGRTPLWTELIKIGSHNFLLGTGFGAFWIGNLTHNLWDQFIWRPTSAHDGYIDIFLQLGIVGLIIFLCVLITSYKNIVNTFQYNYQFNIIRLTYFLMTLVYNITETSLLRATIFSWFLFLLVIVNTPENEEYLQLEPDTSKEEE